MLLTYIYTDGFTDLSFVRERFLSCDEKKKIRYVKFGMSARVRKKCDANYLKNVMSYLSKIIADSRKNNIWG